MIDFKKSMHCLFVAIACLYFLSCNSNSNRNSSAKDCMESVIGADDTLGRQRNVATLKMSLSQSIRNYIEGMEKLQFDGCPQKFADAFSSHISAWKDMLTVTDKHDDLRGEMHDLFEKLEMSADAGEFKSRLDDIWSTWKDVEMSMDVDRKKK